MKADDKLRVRWSKRERDMEVVCPLGSQTMADGGYLLHALNPIVEELRRRGYDTRTLKLSVEPSAGNERFASQRTVSDEVAADGGES